jgi:hypothetical protein
MNDVGIVRCLGQYGPRDAKQVHCESAGRARVFRFQPGGGQAEGAVSDELWPSTLGPLRHKAIAAVRFGDEMRGKALGSRFHLTSRA